MNLQVSMTSAGIQVHRIAQIFPSLRSLVLVAASMAATAPAVRPVQAQAQVPEVAVNAGAATMQEFQKRVGDFVKLHKQVEAKLPPLKPTPVAKEITDHQQQLARGITAARHSAKQGDIFSANISAEFRRLIEIVMRGVNGANIRMSLAHAEPVRIEVGVNSVYPGTVPLQTSPPTLLLNLPKLAPELDYRIVGNALVLRDVTANLIVDFMPGAIPPVPAR